MWTSPTYLSTCDTACSQGCNRRIPSNARSKAQLYPESSYEERPFTHGYSQQAKIPRKRTLGQLSGLLRSPTASSFIHWLASLCHRAERGDWQSTPDSGRRSVPSLCSMTKGG